VVKGNKLTKPKRTAQQKRASVAPPKPYTANTRAKALAEVRKSKNAQALARYNARVLLVESRAIAEGKSNAEVQALVKAISKPKTKTKRKSPALAQRVSTEGLDVVTLAYSHKVWHMAHNKYIHEVLTIKAYVLRYSPGGTIAECYIPAKRNTSAQNVYASVNTQGLQLPYTIVPTPPKAKRKAKAKGPTPNTADVPGPKAKRKAKAKAKATPPPT
jgi:hypothetical protein